MDNDWINRLPLRDIRQITHVGGGDVNQAYRIDTDKKSYFLLVQPDHPQSFYAGEIAGLKAFKEADIMAPRVIASGQINEDAYLLLNYLERGTGKQSDLGRLVAHLHHHESHNGRFGFDYPYSGSSISFTNDWTNSWTELFVHRRLDMLASLLQKKHLWTSHDVTLYEKSRDIIVSELVRHPSKPVLLHGDLWGGNYIFLTDGSPALIDPAAVYGDRELDIGVTMVFGGFTPEFYRAYAAAYPFDNGYEKRLAFYQLYYLMVHLNKFGLSYAGSVSATMSRIISENE
ncbi:fructosamine kinase family protein [Sporolactobacillus shoreicorticis]|uniref:Fructosamine kinase family protein n=1 Tax=Sporolactobacillus shoreicorticis TaxID=1923877 RepID=A0ABW5S141_9BACL|nr:fructosamine kinase family protein [Sporolactobacillus shoreicorticis]MCO7127494.1 fructosamine kinase family protein [Sporolactobacillus shoreicorticis]